MRLEGRCGGGGAGAGDGERWERWTREIDDGMGGTPSPVFFVSIDSKGVGKAFCVSIHSKGVVGRIVGGVDGKRVYGNFAGGREDSEKPRRGRKQTSSKTQGIVAQEDSQVNT